MSNDERAIKIIEQIIKAYRHAERNAGQRPFVLTIYTDADGNVGVWTGQPAGLVSSKVDTDRTLVL